MCTCTWRQRPELLLCSQPPLTSTLCLLISCQTRSLPRRPGRPGRLDGLVVSATARLLLQPETKSTGSHVTSFKTREFKNSRRLLFSRSELFRGASSLPLPCSGTRAAVSTEWGSRRSASGTPYAEVQSTASGIPSMPSRLVRLVAPAAGSSLPEQSSRGNWGLEQAETATTFGPPRSHHIHTHHTH